MNKEAIRIACAEACGWKWWKFTRGNGEHFCHLVRGDSDWPSRPYFGAVQVNEFSSSDPNESPDYTAAPNYPEDANAALEFENALRAQGFRLAFEHWEDGLWNVIVRKPGSFTKSARASSFALAICEAGLRALNKWQDKEGSEK